MAVNAARSIAINLTGDVILNNIYAAAANAVSPGSTTIHALTTGNNTIVIPLATGFTVKGATIVPPSTNTQSIVLKGANTDTGVTLSKTDPTSIAFETAPVNFVLTVGGNIDGLRIVWT